MCKHNSSIVSNSRHPRTLHQRRPEPIERHSHGRSLAVVLIPLVGLWLVPGLSRAQDTTSIPLQQYEPGPGAQDILGVQSATIQKHKEWQVGVHLNIADDVLEVRDPDDNTLYRIIDSQTGLDLMGAIGLNDRFEIGVVVPFTPYRTHGDDGSLVDIPPDMSATALGDIRIVPKVTIPGTPRNLDLALSMPLTLPSGKGEQFYGEGAIGAEPRLLVDYRLTNGVRILANLGVRLRPSKTFENLLLGNEVTFGIGMRAPFQVWGHNLAGVTTVVGSIGMSEADTEEVPIEWLTGLEFKPKEQLSIGLSAGPGITQGYGTPDFRVVLGFSFRWQPSDKPPCLYGAEDMDGFEDDDQCADPDNDEDNIADDDDQCPNEKEILNGVDDQDGCPDDERLEEPPPIPPLQPAVDSDGDTIIGDDDMCPDAPEDMDEFQDLDGCPDLDNDGDAIADVDDKCPLEAEVINGKDDDDGCPDEGKRGVVITQSVLRITKKVYFDTNKATIQQRSFNILDQVAASIRTNQQLTKIRVEGHTDNRGKDDFNMTLSQNRAESVRAYLIGKGIAGERLVAQGYGETRFIDSNKSKVGRAANRRVEFRIIEVNGKPSEQTDSLPASEAPTPPANP